MQAVRSVLPGLALSALVAIAAVTAAPWLARLGVPIPAMVIALLIGIALHGVARRPLFQPGIVFCLKVLLRWAVALLGLRIALGEIAALGLSAAALVTLTMAATLIAGLLLARRFGQEAGFGALAGAGTAVCGASATLATAIVVPDYKGKQADVAFVVVAVNALSTVAMVLYPLICVALGFDERATGIMLGATIHDVAQVVGAGYAVSEQVGNTAVIVKLFRVLLLLPVVLAIGWFFTRRTVAADATQIPFPIFAAVFVMLCAINSIALATPAIAPAYTLVKAPLVEASTWGLLTAIGALGLGTSLTALAALGWRHIATLTGTTVVILVLATAGLMLGA
ncbi:MAG: putative sulfate exporter family transporter [Hyphomicrobiales bacterium]|nr:putative sulfate exporter family transporter [Hyphomicrobiales bacterium]